MITYFFLGLLAFALSTVTGGGASMLLLPLLHNTLPVAQIPLALTLGTTSSTLMRMRLFWKSIRWDIVRWFVPLSLPAVWLGSYLITYLNPVYLEICIGLTMLSNFTQIFARGKADTPIDHNQGPKSRLQIALIGIAAGFLSGLTGAVGLLFNRFYFKWGMNKESIIATRAANELILHLVKLAIYIQLGLFSSGSLLIGAQLAAAGITAGLVMKKLLPYLSEHLFRRLGYLAMVVAGGYILTLSLTHLAKQEHIQWAFVADKESWESKWLWNQSSLAMEWDWNEGVELEYAIAFDDLPTSIQLAVRQKNITPKLIEEVHTLSGVSYEVYYLSGQQIVSTEFDSP